jgi:Protein of unknown function (DUF3263)
VSVGDPFDVEGRWQEVLDFERESGPASPAKELAVRNRFGISSARYYQVLDRLIDRPEALAHDPMLVQRLQRVRETRRRMRFVRRLGSDG